MGYDQTGSYTALAGMVVIILTKVGIITDTTSVVTIIAGVVALYGIIRQFIAHKKLATLAGVIR